MHLHGSIGIRHPFKVTVKHRVHDVDPIEGSFVAWAAVSIEDATGATLALTFDGLDAAEAFGRAVLAGVAEQRLSEVPR